MMSGKPELHMDGKKYIETQMRLIEMAKIANSLDLEAFLKCISNAEAVAPMVDPTLYLKAMDNLKAIKNLAEVGLKVQEAYDKTYKAVLNTSFSAHMSKPKGAL
jgi:hypothetical protein